MRTADGHYLWFALKARPVVGSDGEVVRLVGTLTDVTEFKNAEERLLHDAQGQAVAVRVAQPAPDKVLFGARAASRKLVPPSQATLGPTGITALSVLK